MSQLTETQIHDVRVAIKRLRSLWRLARKKAGRQIYQIHNAELRALARSLSSERDAHVIRKSLAHLHAPAELAPLEPNHPTPSASRVRQILQRNAEAFESLNLKRKDIKRALKASSKDVMKARRKCKKPAAGPERFHEWRKRTKNLMYQLEYACSRGVRGGKKTRGRLEKISRALGKAHDYDVVYAYLLSHRAPRKYTAQAAAERAHFEKKSLRKPLSLH